MDDKIVKKEKRTSVGESGLLYILDSRDILLDIKTVMSDYYIATFTDGGATLKLSFDNGQTFELSVKAA